MIFDPEAVKRSLDELCAEAGVEVFLHALVGAATRDGDRITEIAFQDHGGLHRLSASSFVDASGDCDLACFAGASTRYGNHWTVNLGTLGTRFGGIPRDVVVTTEQLRSAIDAAKARGVSSLSKDRSVIARLPISAHEPQRSAIARGSTHCESPKNCNAEAGASRSPAVLPSMRG